MIRAWSACMLLVLGCGFELPPGDDTSTGNPGTEDGPPTPPTATSTSTTTPPTATATFTSTTAADSSGGTIGDPDSSDEGSFIDEPDGGGPICHSCCDVWAQDCADGDKCTAWANDGGDDWNGTRCSPIDRNPGQPGDSCTVEDSPASGFDDCDLGSMCWNVDPMTLEGHCVALCSGDSSSPGCEDPDTGCMLTNDGVLNLCLPRCEPLASTCPADQTCVASDTTFVCMTTVAGLDAAVAEPCEQIYDCQPGLACGSSTVVGGACDPGEPGCCTPYCDLSAPDPAAVCPDPGQDCLPWVPGGAPPPNEDVGACVLP